MADALDPGSGHPARATSTPPATAATRASGPPPGAPAHPAAEPVAPGPHEPARPAHPRRRWVLLAVILAGLIAGGIALIPTIRTALNTVTTDDAYINGHVTYLAPRVGGRVARVLVDDNMRVRRGDILVQLDREPYEVQRAIARAAVTAAEAGLAAAQATVRGEVAQMRANRYQLERAMEEVNSRIASCGPRCRPSTASRPPWTSRGPTSGGGNNSCPAAGSARKMWTYAARP